MPPATSRAPSPKKSSDGHPHFHLCRPPCPHRQQNAISHSLSPSPHFSFPGLIKHPTLVNPPTPPNRDTHACSLALRTTHYSHVSRFTYRAPRVTFPSSPR